MKKIAFIFCACLFALTTQAQEPEKHLKFMGIELNCTITDFQTKLLAKGLTVSPLSKQRPAGTRVFEGTFSGEKADIFVWYNTRSKIVYRAKAIIKRYGKDAVKQLMSNMEMKLDTKYGRDNKVSESFKDDYLHEFEQITYFLKEGDIGLFIGSTGYSDLSDFYLHVDYNDKINNTKNRADEMDDL